MNEPRFRPTGGGAEVVIGIDLGTSHTSISWARTARGAEPREILVAQWVSGRRRDSHVLLPSVLYAPLPGELPQVAAAEPLWVAGEYARTRSRETLGRGISSAKSWLCHPAVDRLGPILPWGAEAGEGVTKLSPVEVSRRILEEVRSALEAELQREGVRGVASVILTVPASFDQTARRLTLLAAERAGLEVRLLEEPQAVFYEYLGRHAAELGALVSNRGPSRVLVCDIGGGTTDLSLIEVSAHGGALEFRRSAVGRHLLLGGDNMDLSLARRAEQKLGSEVLDAERFGQLLLAARSAKETLLAAAAPETYSLQVAGKGSTLLGSTLSAELERGEAIELLLDGFFPLIPRGELPVARRAALTTFGLPFERDPAITRHIWQFLERHTAGQLPQALLLNGGVTRAASVRERLLECFRRWTGEGEEPVELLTAPDPELAVSRGAVRYGLALQGLGPRIQGGAAQGYYVGVEAGGAVRQALCVVPRGAREGERHVIGARRFELTVGRPARFELYASDTALHAPGAVVAVDADFQALPPLTAELRLPFVEDDTRVPVQLEGELSAVGTLELECTFVRDAARSSPDPQRCTLQFELQGESAPVPASKSPSSRAALPAGRLGAAEEALRRVFGKGRKDVTPREVKDLSRTLERILGLRKGWDVELSRHLVDLVLDGTKARLRSEEHERAYWMLAGYCLRPGFGHPRDAERIARLWPALEAGVTFQKAERGWQQYWIAVRRVAGGLAETMQVRLRELIDPALAPPERKLKPPKGFRPLAQGDMLALASHLERVPAASREELGHWIVDRTWMDRDPRLWTYLGRVGARVPTYASAHYAVRASAVERWVEQLLRERWSEVGTAAAAAVSLARVTGDQVRDLAPRVRGEVAAMLRRSSAPEAWICAVTEYVPVTEAERTEQLGDDLPIGLRLID